ncbi:MAG TPA: hypothetical protein VH092_01825, partial [Urbifossiella sp.]|nr:hypothetical protein [Urbifossiella sp.]
MSVAADALAALARLGRDPMSGVYLRPPAGEAEIRQMQAIASEQLGEPVPDEYLALLRATDGAQVNGAYFKPAGHLVAENLDVPRPEVIVLGNAGSVAEFVFDRRDRRFHEVVMGFADERLASFDS